MYSTMYEDEEDRLMSYQMANMIIGRVRPLGAESLEPTPPRRPHPETIEMHQRNRIISQLPRTHNYPEQYTTMVPAGTHIQQHHHQKRTRLQSGMFNRLSDGLVLKILSYLETPQLLLAGQVCKRLHTICWNSPECWRIIQLRGEGSGDKLLKMIFKRLQPMGPCFTFIERIFVTSGCKLTDKSLASMGRRCPELTHLQVQLSNTISDEGVAAVIKLCTNLQHLDLTGCPQISNFCGGSELLQRRFLLQYLDLTDCVSVDDYSLQNIVRHCPQLVYFYLRRCVQITDAGLKAIASYASLRELSISDCTSISDFGLYELAKLGAQLRYLSVAKCNLITDAGLKMIARHCYKIRYLNTRNCLAISDDALMWLARNCPRLRAIDIGGCDITDSGLKVLAESCPNLKKLSLRSANRITDFGLNYVSYYCRGLQHLNIQDCQISSEGYRSVKMYCKRCFISHTNPGFG